MILYVMRHAEAVEGNDTLQDEWRYLTEKGRVAAEKIGTQVSKAGPKPRLTVSSPLTRAVQTAEIVAKKACRKNVVISSALLLPGAEIRGVVEFLNTCQEAKRIMLVGHEPQLGLLVATLLQQENRAITLKKGSCVALDFDPGKDGKKADFLWYSVAGKKRITSIEKAFPLKAGRTDVTEG